MKYVVIAGIIILAVFLFFLIRIPKGIEPLTELYFDNHTSLPVNVFPNKIYNYTFTVHNLEYINMSYTYNITAEYDIQTNVSQFNNDTNSTENSTTTTGTTIFLDTGHLFLSNNQSQDVFQTFKLPPGFGRAEVQVLLIKDTPNPLQKDPNLQNITLDIHFWVDEISGPKIIITPD